MKILILLVAASILCCCKTKTSITTMPCKPSQTKNLSEFDKLYSNIDSTSCYKNGLKVFDHISTGVMMVKFKENLNKPEIVIFKKSDETLSNFDNSFQIKYLKLSRNDSNSITVLLNNLNSMCYFDQCDNIVSNNDFLLMVVKVDNEIISKYFSHGDLSFEQDSEDKNFNFIKQILEIMYRNSYQ